MNINDLKEAELTEPLAYILGLIYPLIKIVEVDNKKYLAGSINHNPDKVTTKEITMHYKSFLVLLNQVPNLNILLRANNIPYFKINSKRGFSVLVELGDKNIDDIEGILKEKVDEIFIKAKEKIDNSIVKEFLKGCFDGRSSYDSTGKYLSLDIDSDEAKKNLIHSIFKEYLNIDLNINTRRENSNKNDQLRITEKDIRKYKKEIGLRSVCRKKILENKGY